MKRMPLLMLAIVTVLPTLGALLLYASGWRPKASSSYGELLAPVGPLAAEPLVTEGGQAAGWPELKGTWALVYFAPDPCDEACNHVMLVSRAVWWALDKEQTRVKQVLVHHGSAPATEATVLRLVRPPVKPDSAQAADGQLMIVDPMGNAVLRYAGRPAASGIGKDLKHLLKNSWVG